MEKAWSDFNDRTSIWAHKIFFRCDNKDGKYEPNIHDAAFAIEMLKYMTKIER